MPFHALHCPFHAMSNRAMPCRNEPCPTKPNRSQPDLAEPSHAALNLFYRVDADGFEPAVMAAALRPPVADADSFGQRCPARFPAAIGRPARRLHRRQRRRTSPGIVPWYAESRFRWTNDWDCELRRYRQLFGCRSHLCWVFELFDRFDN